MQDRHRENECQNMSRDMGRNKRVRAVDLPGP